MIYLYEKKPTRFLFHFHVDCFWSNGSIGSCLSKIYEPRSGSGLIFVLQFSFVSSHKIEKISIASLAHFSLN